MRRRIPVVVMILETVPRSLRGMLSRWLLEIVPGVFVGEISARIRDLLWERILREIGMQGRACQVWNTNNEQGFDLKLFGYADRKLVDLDGLRWVAVKNAKWQKICSQNKEKAT